MHDEGPTDRSDPNSAAIDLVIEARQRELTEGFKVRRVLPHYKRRMIGPFIFFDEMGPEILKAGNGLDVAPHPHIGLATVTYLFKGQILHRDGLATEQLILPGEVNWMTAGRGIAHSERTPASIRETEKELFGIQTWLALPTNHEETAPAFHHYGSADLPVVDGDGKTARIIAGSLFGQTSPVDTFSEMFYADVAMESGAALVIPTEHEERAVFVVEGSVEFRPDGNTFAAGQLVSLKPRYEVTVSCPMPSRLMLFGGQPLAEKRHIWWNFVSSSKERIEQAKDDWKEGRFAPVPNETEFIPLPADSGPVVPRYP